MTMQGNPRLKNRGRATKMSRRRLLQGATRGTIPNSVPVAPAPNGGQGSAPVDPAQLLAPWEPSSGDVWDKKKAAHLMRRAGFGATPDELATIVDIGMEPAIDALLTEANWPLQPHGIARLPHGEVLSLTHSTNSQAALWIHEAVYGLAPLREKMALFWHDHFSVGAETGNQTPVMTRHINIFRKHGMGRFRDMLIDVTRDPAMQYWLDNYLNGRRGLINENYGRELMELYTQGEGSGYTETDVKEASACLAGWSVTGYDRYLYRSSYYINRSKKVLGKTIYSPRTTASRQSEGLQLIDHLLAQKVCAQFIVGKICRYFVTETPPKEVVDELADRLRSDGYNFRSLMGVILRSRWFYSSQVARTLVKNPMEYVVGAIRNLGIPTIHRYSSLPFMVELMGLRLLRYGDPSGLADGVAWMDAQAIITRANFANQLTQVSPTSGIRTRFKPWVELDKAKAVKATQIVDFYLSVLVDGDVPTKVRSDLINFMHQTNWVTIDFDLLTRPNQEQKIRGLIHVIMSLPEYHMN